MGDLDGKIGEADGFQAIEPDNVAGGFVSAPPVVNDVEAFWEEGAPAPVVQGGAKKPRITKKSRGGMELPRIPPLAARKPAPVVEEPGENFRLPTSIVIEAALSATNLSAPSPKPVSPALAFEEEPTQQDTRPAPKPAPVAAPAVSAGTLAQFEKLKEMYREPAEPIHAPRRNGWKWAAGLTGIAAAGLAAWGIIRNQVEAPSEPELPTMAEITPVPIDSVDIPTPAPTAAPVTHNSAPVYTTVAAAFAGDAQEDLEKPTATNALVHDFYVGDSGPHTWEGIRTIHPWAETHEALQDLEGKLSTWGGYTAVLESGESCNPQSISDFVYCVAHDKNIPHAGVVALNLSEQITAIQDLKIMPDQGAVLEMHEKMNEGVPAMVKEINANPPVAPKPFHYPTATSAAGAEGSFGSLYDAPDPMNSMKEQHSAAVADLGVFLEDEDDIDLAPYLETVDASDVVEPLHVKAASTDVEQVAAHAGLNGLATWMENAQSDLIKKARGKNRELLPDFCAGVASEMRAMAERFDGLSPSGQEVALLDLKQNFFARMDGLKNGDGQFKSKYLEGLSHGFTAMLAEMLPPLPEGIEGVQGRTRREVLATLPQGMFRPSVA